MLRQVAPLAMRSLLRNRRRSLITLGAISVGVAVVVFANGVGNGFLMFIVEQTINARTGALQVHRKGYMQANEMAPLKLDMPLSGDLVQKIRSTPGVKAVAPRIRFGGMVSNGEKSSMVMGFALDPTAELTVCPERPTEVGNNGLHINSRSSHGVVVGAELASSFKAKLGSGLVVTANGRDGGVNALDVDIIGITRGAMPIESKRIFYMPLRYAQELLQMEGRVTEFAVAVDDVDQLATVARALEERLGGDFEVSTWDEVVPFLRDITARIDVVLKGVSVVLFVIVVFGVINTMLMSVYERVREIGTMLAIGLRRAQILMLFLLEAVALGALGGILGAVVGFAVTAYFSVTGIVMHPPGSPLTQLVRPDASPSVALVAVAGAIVGGLLAAAWPAHKASLMNPVDALRTM
jgi:putative ABC transport system permease protein